MKEHAERVPYLCAPTSEIGLLCSSFYCNDTKDKVVTFHWYLCDIDHSGYTKSCIHTKKITAKRVK
jgi:hypothetical protein